MTKQTKKILALSFRSLRFAKSSIQTRMNRIGKRLKGGCRKVKCQGFTLLVQNSQRRTLIRSEVVKALGESWVSAHERKTNFKLIRIVEDKK